MGNVIEWIEHLKHPLVLIGFGLFILATLFKPIFSNNFRKLSGRAATERLLRKSINYIFILSLLTVVVGFVRSLKSETDNLVITQQDTTVKNKNLTTIEQHTSGEKSPSINSGADVQVNYDGKLSNQKKTKQVLDTIHKQSPPIKLKQTTKGNKSPVINSSGNVSINYAE